MDGVGLIRSAAKCEREAGPVADCATEQKNKKPTRSSFYVPSAAVRTPKTRKNKEKNPRLAENVENARFGKEIDGIRKQRRNYFYGKKHSFYFISQFAVS